MRLTDVFVAACILVIAGSAGVLAWSQAGLAPEPAAFAGLATLCVLALIRLQTLRARANRDLSGRLDETARRLTTLGADFHTLERRLGSLETAFPRRAREEIEPIAGEVEVLGTIVKQIAESVAELELREAKRANATARPAPLSPALGLFQPPEKSGVPAPAEPARTALRPAAEAPPALFSGAALKRMANVPARFAGQSPAAIAAALGATIGSDRIALFMQPIVSLPQRKLRWYALSVRLDFEDEAVPASDLAAILPSGTALALDKSVLLRAARLQRQLSGRSGETGLFCPINPATLGAVRVRDLLAALEPHRGLAGGIVLTLPAARARNLMPNEASTLSALRDLGFAFAVEGLTEIKDLGGLSDRGFRYARIDVERLVGPNAGLNGDVRPPEIAAHLERGGIDLVAEGVAAEAQAIELLDAGVKFAAGALFGAAAPVRGELLQEGAGPESGAGGTGSGPAAGERRTFPVRQPVVAESPRIARGPAAPAAAAPPAAPVSSAPARR